MDKRILISIGTLFLLGVSIFCVEKVFSANIPVSVKINASHQKGTNGEIIDFTCSNDGIEKWKWDFDDDEFDFTQNPRHLFAMPGTYKVRLTLSGKFGSVQSEEFPIEITESKPTISVVDSNTLHPPKEVETTPIPQHTEKSLPKPQHKKTNLDIKKGEKANMEDPG